jgi:predicted enzyme related to lactoylglutathione lyase
MPLNTDSWPAGVPCWVDLSVPNVDAAKAFYEAVLGWTLEDQGEQFGHYHLATIDGHQAAGLGPPMEPGQPSVWTLYFSAPEIDATAAAVTENGGTVLLPPMEVGPMGSMAIAIDPTGAAFGLWKSGTHSGVDVYNQPGALTWEDLRSPAPDAARAFYSSTFGFAYQPVEGAPEDYTTFHATADPLGGIGGMMGVDTLPPHWAVYFGVADADAANAAAVAHGGSIAVPAFDTPFGRMSALVDPGGAFFWTVEMPAAA